MTPTPGLGPILAATDFSAPARHAADRAARLAHQTGAPLTLLHVLAGGPLLVLAPADLTEMLPVLMGMLGLGALRTFEKTKGVAR